MWCGARTSSATCLPIRMGAEGKMAGVVRGVLVMGNVIFALFLF